MQSQTETPDTVADAAADNWVDRYAPRGWRPFLRLSRADRPIGTWLLLLPCWWGIGLAMMATGPRWFDLWIAIACAIGALLMRGAGCTWNDITDRDIDGSVERTRSRPIPSGRVTLKAAHVWLAVQAFVAFLILLTLGRMAILLGVASLVLVAIYPFAKRFTWWPQLFLGLAFNWGALLAYAAHMGRVDCAPVAAYLGGIAWTIFYDTIYAHQDADDDALIGVRSTARLFGEHSPVVLLWFGALTVVMLALAIVLTGEGAVIGLIGLGGFGAHLLWQWWRFDPKDKIGCHRLFLSNRDAGLILALFLAMAGLL